MQRRWLVLSIEIAWVVLFSAVVGREFLDFSPTMRIHGVELEWVTSPMAWATQVWQQDGYIPRWTPYISSGQPTVDHGHSMLFNPVVSVPSLILGVNSGTKLSILLFLIVGGTGGLALGYRLGWGLPARVLLAGLLIARGSTIATFGLGYPQTAAQQMYFPWVLTGIVGLARGDHARICVAIVAISLSQIMLSGNIYHILPATVMAAVLVILFAVRFRPRFHIDGLLIRRALLAAIFAAGLMAVVALSTLLLYPFVRGRMDFTPEQTQEFGAALQQFVVPDVLMPNGVEENNRYVYVAPWWFVVALFAFLPPIPRLLYRSRTWWIDSRLWIFLVVGFVFFAAMGVGVNPISTWLWNTIDLLRQWRFLERMLGVAGFLLAVLICLRFDGLWYALQTHLLQRRTAGGPQLALKGLLSAAVVAAVAVPLWVETSRTFRFSIEWTDMVLASCLGDLVSARPHQPVSVDASLYVTIWPYFANNVRLASLQTNYDHRGIPSTLMNDDLTILPAEFYVSYGESIDRLTTAGYRPIERATDCEWPTPILHNPGALPYAFSAPVRVFETNDVEQVIANAVPVEVVLFEPERTILRAENPTNESIAVVAQTIAYPGWEARINGEPATLESVGQLQGVILPPNTPSASVEFVYIPTTFFVGAWITILTTILLIAYLLRVDVHVRRWWVHRTQARDSHGLEVAPSTLVPIPVPAVVAAEQRPSERASVIETATVNRGWVVASAAVVVTAIAGAVAIVFGIVGWLLVRRRSGTD